MKEEHHCLILLGNQNQVSPEWGSTGFPKMQTGKGIYYNAYSFKLEVGILENVSLSYNLNLLIITCDFLRNQNLRTIGVFKGFLMTSTLKGKHIM